MTSWRPSLHMNGHSICSFISQESWDTSESNFWRPSWPPSWKICNCRNRFTHIHTLRPSLHMNKHFTCPCISQESWDTSESNFWRPSWPPSWKICNCRNRFTHIHTLRPSLHMNRHFTCPCISQESWDTSESNFWRPSWPPSWKICNCRYWFTHIHTLRPSLYKNQHFICLCIWKESWDTFVSEFWRPCWPPFWKKNFFQIFKFLTIFVIYLWNLVEILPIVHKL